MPPRAAIDTSECRWYEDKSNHPRVLTRRPRKARVQFLPQVTIIPHIHLDEYSYEEYDASFYSELGYARMKESCKATVRQAQIMGDAFSQSPCSCLRGLERLLNPKRSRLTRQQAWSVVFEEQEIQRDQAIFKNEAIAAVYAAISANCREEAQILAIRDSLAAFTEEF